LRSQSERLEDVGSCPEAAVDQNGHACPDLIDDGGEGLERCGAVVQGPAAVVGHDEPLDSVLEPQPHVVDGDDALEQHGTFEEPADFVEMLPRQTRPHDVGHAIRIP
jgi:hypothetical protein